MKMYATSRRILLVALPLLLLEKNKVVKSYTTTNTIIKFTRIRRYNTINHHHSNRKFDSNLTLNMAKQRRSSNANKKINKKKKKNNSIPKRKNDNPMMTTTSEITIDTTTTATTTKDNQKEKREYKRPPWEILSKSEIKSNAKILIKRREDIKNGLLSPSTPLPPDLVTKSDTSRSNKLLSNEDRMLYNWKPFSFVNDIDDVQFNGPFFEDSTYPNSGIPEIAFLGRSNVGKSSLLNALLSTSSPSSSSSSSTSGSNTSNNYARVGKTPGATASINYYTLLSNKNKKNISKPLINFVDLPGFGYAKLSKSTQSSLGIAMQRYINQRKHKQLALGILLLDIRRTPTENDKAIINALYDQNVPICMVATKIDKYKNDHEGIQKQLEHIEYELGVSEEDSRILPVSSVKKINVKELWKIIIDACQMKVAELNGEEIDDDDDNDEEEEEGDYFYEDE